MRGRGPDQLIASVPPVANPRLLAAGCFDGMNGMRGMGVAGGTTPPARRADLSVQTNIPPIPFIPSKSPYPARRNLRVGGPTRRLQRRITERYAPLVASIPGGGATPSSGGST